MIPGLVSYFGHGAFCTINNFCVKVPPVFLFSCKYQAAFLITLFIILYRL